MADLESDLMPCRGASLDDLALDLFTLGYRRQINPEIIADCPVDQQLASLRFFSLKRRVPNNAGILLFGKDPRRWLPGAYVQFLQFNGTSLADDIIAKQEISGDLLSVLRQLDIVTKAQVRQRPVPVDGSVLREQVARTYPVTALREFLLNAVMHRSYQSNEPIRYYCFLDRVEIQSPGGLYGEARPENFPDQNDYRNPVLAEAMKILGYVNRYGRGVLRAQAELRNNGNPEAELRFDAGFVQVTARSAL